MASIPPIVKCPASVFRLKDEFSPLVRKFSTDCVIKPFSVGMLVSPCATSTFPFSVKFSVVPAPREIPPMEPLRDPTVRLPPPVAVRVCPFAFSEFSVMVPACWELF